jgi:hypothetical protein
MIEEKIVTLNAVKGLTPPQMAQALLRQDITHIKKGL